MAPTRRLNETFGHALVSVKASTPTGWSHLVAVLSAITPRGEEIVVSQGGVPTTTLRGTTRTLTIRLLSQATTIPRGSRFRLTLAGVSTAQNPNNLLYLTGPGEHARASSSARRRSSCRSCAGRSRVETTSQLSPSVDPAGAILDQASGTNSRQLIRDFGVSPHRKGSLT